MAGSFREDDDNESVLDSSEQLNRPVDNAFHQQRIEAWAPILDPVWVICFLLYLGIIMVPVGYKIDAIQKDVVEMKETYDGFGMDHACGINETYNANGTCYIEFTAEKDLVPPILVHYEITNFYQNHRSYYMSRDSYQLRGETAKAQAATAAKLACQPLHTLGDTLLYPCGMTANTMFNDVFRLVGGNDIYGEPLELIEEGIAWASDLRYMFKQHREFRSEPCPDNDPTGCCDEEEWSCQVPHLNKKDGLYYRYYYPDENTTQYLYETYPDIVNPLEGVENEHFVVWMRVAAHGDFRKLYGWINQPIAKGETLRFEVWTNFVVTRFSGTKSLLVGTTSIFGGRNTNFPGVFKGVGFFCLIAGFLFAVKHKFRPRKLADPAYLHFKDE